ncbi:2997_t:CDS:10, partial [Gigaspora margarita]
MPDLGYKTKDFRYQTWCVNKLTRRSIGPKFKAGGWKWHVLLNPSKYIDWGKISIYLQIADSQISDINWRVNVQFALILWNSKKPTQYFSRQMYHRFNAEEPKRGFDWNYHEFYDHNNRTLSLIESSSCNITVLIRVLEDSKIDGYVGLKNPGVKNTLLNSVIQSLFYIKYLRRAVYQIPIESDKSAKSIASALQRIFIKLNTSDSKVEATELSKFFGWDVFCINNGREMIRTIQDDLENKMKNTKADGTISKLFIGTMKTYIKCVNIDYEFLQVNNYYDIQLNFKGCKTLDDAFMKYIQEETLQDDNKYYTIDYGLQINHLDKFPAKIDLQKYLSPYVDRSKSYKYLLHGILVQDTLSQNKYSALLRPEMNRGWVLFDDDKVTPVSLEYAYEDILKYKVVYMLVYIRESDIDEILSSIIPKDMPKSLLEEENAARERRIKELTEGHQYMQVRIVTEKIIKNHKGIGLFNIDDTTHWPLSKIHKFKVLKKETYSDFKKMVSEKFKIPINQIRFWAFTYRPNIGIRIIGIHEFINDHFLDLRKIYVQDKNTVDNIFPTLCKRKQFSPNTPLDVYVEFWSYGSCRVEKMMSFDTFDEHNGGAICFQKTLTNDEILEHVSAGRVYSIPQFYASLASNLIIQFKSKFGYKEPTPEFSLILNTQMTYETVAYQVATHLNIDPLRLRFATGQFKEIDRNTKQELT